MAKNKKIKRETDGIVYSTESSFVFKDLFEALQEEEPTKQGKLNIRIENKGRGGKTATIIEGFTMSPDEIRDLSKALKNHCGTGGSYDETHILIQGDQRKKIMDYLQSKGFKTNKAI